MKLSLINTNFGIVTVPSLGLGFLGGYIKEHCNDIDIEVIEPKLQGITRKELLDKVKNSDYLGMTCYTENRFECIDFAKECKDINPNIKIILGGPHTFSLDKLLLKNYPFIDYIIRSDGEIALKKLLNNTSLKDIQGLTYRNKNSIIRNKLSIERNIDNFRYDYSLCYIKDWKDSEVPKYLMKYNHLPFISSRGCPYNCTFCATPRICGRYWRGYSIEILVDELEYLINKYKIKYFRFYDALFMPNPKQVEKFYKLVKERDLDFYFRIDAHIGTKMKVYKMLREIGCSILGFGIESGSDRILEEINKNISVKEILETIKITKKLYYWIIGYFMVSHPTETLKDFKNTKDLMVRFDVNNLQFFKIHPDTHFYDYLKSKEYINDNVWFDRKYGIKSRYGYEVYYCKELFPNAPFSIRGFV